jgi:hypothetical protein
MTRVAIKLRNEAPAPKRRFLPKRASFPRGGTGGSGFGTVWMAEQSVPISRKVALKVNSPQGASGGERQNAFDQQGRKLDEGRARAAAVNNNLPRSTTIFDYFSDT